MSHLPFFWGAATSSHQVEGGNLRNDWWAWEQAGRTEPSGKACNHYELFREDIDLIHKLGHSAYRFSLEWSRIEPEPGVWSREALEHYRQVLIELQAKKIEPVVTLHHFTNPQWLMDQGGWLAPDIVPRFRRYVQKVVEALGDQVRFWITINEPIVYIYHGYLQGIWPPGQQSYEQALRVFRNMLLAHQEAYDAIHQHQKGRGARPWVSVANHMIHFEPSRGGSMADRWTVFLRDWFLNRLTLEALDTGFLFFPGMFCEFLPRQRTLDFIGVNYYKREFVRAAGAGEDGGLGKGVASEECRPSVEKNSLGWEVYPEGLRRVLQQAGHLGLALMVTENGICTEEDAQRDRFIRHHLKGVGELRAEGLPVLGYFYWSLMDNFEWAEGFDPRFGIVEVDYENFYRKIRPSAQVLSEVCRKIENEAYRVSKRSF